VPLTALLDAAGLRPSARQLVFTGADHGTPTEKVRRFDRSLSVGRGEHQDVLVATAMNGAPLTDEHGAPARLVVPGWYGMAWVKWLDRIEARATEFEGHFQTSKYTYRFERDGRPTVEPVRRVRVKSLLTSPAPGQRLVRGSRYRVTGKAWSGSAPVVKVEVDVGDGWRSARLTSGEGRYDWSTWEAEWVPRTAGPARIRSRATDACGEAQPAALFDNEYQYGCNSVQVVEVEVR
jgi:DMSO/TMAO reductase YedYZ molybdopterin-dependent catalytic subunit